MRSEHSSIAPDERIPDLTDILHILKRHKTLMMRVMGVCVALGVALVLLMPTYYRAYATLVLNESTPNIEDFQNVLAGAKLDTMSVQTEVKILNSSSLALKTIEKTGLDKNPQFSSSSMGKLEVASKFMKNLTVDPQGTSRAIEISFKARDPQLAADITNAHAAAYLESQIAFKQQQVEQLSKWFETKVRDLKADAIRKAQAVQDFRARERLVVGRDNKELIYQQISDVAGEIVPVEVHKYGMKARAENGTQAAVMDEVVNSPVIQNLKTQASIISQQLGSLGATYGPNHPKVVEAQSQLAQVNQAIRDETNTIRNSITSSQNASEAQEGMLKDRLDSLNREADTLREKMITLESLQLEADASKKILDNFLANYENIQSQISFAWPDATLVSPAVAPIYPAPPGKKMMLMLVLLFSACLTLGVVFFMELLKKGVRNFEDIRKLAQRPLGIIPQVADPAGMVHSQENFSYREALRRIYMSGLLNSPARTILVTSAMPKEGRTTFVISMARYLQSLGHRVAVIDADFLNPSLSRMLGQPNGPGFTDVLTGRVPLAKALITEDAGLAILRAGSHALASPDALQEQNLHAVLDKMKREFAFVLIDSGPLLAHSEAVAIAKQADGILVLTEWLKTSQQNITNMLATLGLLPTPVLGMVINKVDIGKYKSLSSGSDFLLPKAANAA